MQRVIPQRWRFVSVQYDREATLIELVAVIELEECGKKAEREREREREKRMKQRNLSRGGLGSNHNQINQSKSEGERQTPQNSSHTSNQWAEKIVQFE